MRLGIVLLILGCFVNYCMTLMIPSITRFRSFRRQWVVAAQRISPLYSPRNCYAPSILFSSTSNSLNVEGDEIELLDGSGRGRIIEKLKGGWFKCSVVNLEGAEIIVKLRSSKFRLATVKLSQDLQESTTQVKISPSKDSQVADILSVNTEENEKIYRVDLPYLVPPERHVQTNNWILFSDLHVKGSSIDTCEAALIEINRVAKQKNAGIVFLGDFWHVRGALSVELLNRVMKVFRTWTQPVIMIPGNHDQVTLGGSVHALEPLMYAFPPGQAILISEPTICLGALWVPYRRDSALMKSILKAGTNHPDVNIIFCHADVRGAFMNDNMKCKEGIDVTEFPPEIPIFSGHFHKPHTMKQGNSSLRYLGSPYQTSLSEAGQIKYLYRLSTTSDNKLSKFHTRKWKEVERWPIDLGKKYFKASSIDDIAAIQSARPGDRLVLPVKIGEDVKADDVVQPLRTKGVEVELRYESSPRFRMKGGNASGSDETIASNTAIVNEINASSDSDPSPVTVYDTFMKTANVTQLLESLNTPNSNPSQNVNSATLTTLHEQVYREGKKVVERLSGYAEAEHEGKSTAKAFSSKGSFKELRFETVKLKDFGPYGGDQVTYPLSSRGLVLLRGKSSDGTGADSNGSGKTTLAMSVKWGLTGFMDTRLVADGKAVDVAYDTGSSNNKRTAEVIVTGTINSLPFSVTRRRGKKQELLFVLNDKDLTKQAMKDTQAAIDEELGIGNDLLQRCCFFGQHSHTMTSLLGLSDKGLKTELGSSQLVDVDLWNAALLEVRTKERKDKARINDLTIETKVRREEIKPAELALQQAEAKMSELNNELTKFKVQTMSSKYTYSPNETMTVDQINEELRHLSENIDTHSKTILLPLRESVLEIANRKATINSVHDSKISATRELMVKSKTAQSSQQQLLNSLKTKSVQLDQQRNTALSSIKSMIASLDDSKLLNSQNVLLEAINVDSYRRTHEALLSEIAGINVRIKTTETSLRRLEFLNTPKDSHSHSNHEDVESCPTCGQNLPRDLQFERENELKRILKELSEDHRQLQNRAEIQRKKVDLCYKIKSYQDQLNISEARLNDMQEELKTIENSLKIRVKETEDIEAQLSLLTKVKQETMNKVEFENNELSKKLKDAENTAADLVQREKYLRQQLEVVRNAETKKKIIENEYQSMSRVLEEKILSNELIVKEKRETLKAAQDKIAMAEAEKQSLIESSVILERLGEVFGARGIQHFVFMNVIRQIETIANNYLVVLADGGIQITLQADDNDDRITKTILIRSVSSGEFRERALSQLSGGQWRRVSLALDLAFTELVRRRGILRSNLLVMDEVLTHLDASGREAVGTVIRAMTSIGSKSAAEATLPIQNTGLEYLDTDDETKKDNSEKALSSGDISNLLVGSGTYETVIVILQDLVAMELEESFDHVDVVVKEGDFSKINLDGELSR